MVGVAVNVTGNVAQTGLAEATMLTLAGVVGNMVNVSVLLVTGLTGTQLTPPTLSTQVITSPLARSAYLRSVTVWPLAVAEMVAPDNAMPGAALTVNCVGLKIFTIRVFALKNPVPAVTLTRMPGKSVAVLATVTVTPLLEPPVALPVIVVPFFFQS